ncbi:MAG: hypothetical protein GY928_30800 [Colwellia sp.]|nr:hypothetical protein [Colwellia sp.]
MSRWKRTDRTPKSISQKLNNLDDHQFLLRRSLHDLPKEPANLKILATELRTLVCCSSGVDGLLWRLCDELSVSDQIELFSPLSIKRDHPLSKGLQFDIYPAKRPDQLSGLPNAKAELLSLRKLFEQYEAVYLPTIKEKILTHETLIKAVAQQIGSAHEDEGIDPDLDRLSCVLLNGQSAYFQILKQDAEFSLQIGERVLDAAEAKGLYQRKLRKCNNGDFYGDLTLIARLGWRELVVGEVDILRFRSDISEVDLALKLRPKTVEIKIMKREQHVRTLNGDHPANWGPESDASFAFCYSTSERKARIVLNRIPLPSVDCNAGWISAEEFSQPVSKTHDDSPVILMSVLLYGRHVSPDECQQLLGFSIDLRETFEMKPPQTDSPFPD